MKHTFWVAFKIVYPEKVAPTPSSPVPEQKPPYPTASHVYNQRPKATPTDTGGIVVEFSVEIPDAMFEPMVADGSVRAVFPAQHAVEHLQATEKQLSSPE